MELGGAERALLGLLYAIDTNKVDVDLFINQHTGPFMTLIPDKVNLLPEIPAYSVIEKPLTEAIRKRQWGIMYGRLLAKLKYRYYSTINKCSLDGTITHYVMDSVIRFLPSLYQFGHYDLAISFLDPPHIVQDKVDASKRIEWIHTDFSGNNFFYNHKLTFNRWAANDFIISISDDVSKQFLVGFPKLEEKIVKIENIIPSQLIFSQAEMGECKEYLTFDSDTIKICSVGRLSHAKNFECIPIVATILKARGLNFHWWVVGPGDITPYLEIIKQEGMEDFVTFIGAKENPYPYMKQCDIYVQPSRYEGKAVTVQEAQMLGRPVVITDYPTASSQVIHGIDGIICGMKNEEIANAILDLAIDKDRMISLGRQAAEMHVGNNKEVQNLYKILGI